MNSLYKEPFLHKAHDLIAFKIFYLKELFLHMTKKMTPSILKLKGSKPNLNLIGIAHHTRGQKVHIGVYSEPKPKEVSSLELLKHLL
jgi:hypothetical protein